MSEEEIDAMIEVLTNTTSGLLDEQEVVTMKELSLKEIRRYNYSKVKDYVEGENISSLKDKLTKVTYKFKNINGKYYLESIN